MTGESASLLVDSESRVVEDNRCVVRCRACLVANDFTAGEKSSLVEPSGRALVRALRAVGEQILPDVEEVCGRSVTAENIRQVAFAMPTFIAQRRLVAHIFVAAHRFPAIFVAADAWPYRFVQLRTA